MAFTLTEVVRQFKTDWTKCLEPEAILDACRAEKHVWRDRILNPVVLVQVFLLQVLHGNTACQHLRHLAGITFSAGAYCLARMALPLAVFQRLLRNVSERINGGQIDAMWHGHRTLYLDGTGFSMPDTAELQAEFGQPGGQKKGCGFPVAHLLTLFHAGTGMLLDVFMAPLRTLDLAMAAQVHLSLKPNDVLVADRGFCSYAHFALLLQSGVHAVMRIHQKMVVNFTPHRPHVVRRHGRKSAAEKRLPSSRWIRTLGYEDQVVMWMKPVSCPTWMTADQFLTLADGIEIRELRYRVQIPGFRVQVVTLATTLLDADRYSASDLADLYRLRWDIETNLSHLKTSMGLDVLKCKTVDGVLKEMIVFCLLYNLISLVMLNAARTQNVDVRRISFIDALRWLASADAGETLVPLTVNPARPDRCEPRVRKRRPKQFPVMKQPRKVLQDALKNKGRNA
jgi:hypothetical protein